MAEPVKGERSTSVERLVTLIETLRGENGCPWDRKQTPESMARYLIEEAHELVDAITSGNAEEVCEEAGDVLFQLLFIVRLFREKACFDFQDVIEKIIEKMIRRHPHVFGDEKVTSTDQVLENWQKIKQDEKGGKRQVSVLDAVPQSVPALLRAAMVSEKAVKTGFDWPDIAGVMAQTMDEWREFSDEIDMAGRSGENKKASVEFGDVLFTMVNVARFAKIDPEIALTQSIQKFEKRFRYMEGRARDAGKQIEGISFEEMHKLWNEAKEALG